LDSKRNSNVIDGKIYKKMLRIIKKISGSVGKLGKNAKPSGKNG